MKVSIEDYDLQPDALLVCNPISCLAVTFLTMKITNPWPDSLLVCWPLTPQGSHLFPALGNRRRAGLKLSHGHVSRFMSGRGCQEIMLLSRLISKPLRMSIITVNSWKRLGGVLLVLSPLQRLG